MPSAWIAKRGTSTGVRYRVMWRSGGRESVPRYGGSFRTLRDAHSRRAWVVGELAAMRILDLALLAEPLAAVTVAEAAKRWQASRVDVAESTRIQHRTAVGRLLPIIGARPVDQLAAADVADLVVTLAAAGKARESIRKTVTALAMVLDHAGVTPNERGTRQAAGEAAAGGEARNGSTIGRTRSGGSRSDADPLPTAAACA